MKTALKKGCFRVFMLIMEYFIYVTKEKNESNENENAAKSSSPECGQLFCLQAVQQCQTTAFGV